MLFSKLHLRAIFNLEKSMKEEERWEKVEAGDPKDKIFLVKTLNRVRHDKKM